MTTLPALLTLAVVLAAAAAAPGAAATAQQPDSNQRHGRLSISSAQRMRALAQAAPAAAPAAATATAAAGPPGASAARGPPGAPPGPPPNSTQLAGIIIGSFNASADRTPQVPDTPLADQNRSTTGRATVTPQGWPLVGNWTAIMNNRWRIMGPEVVAKREQVELYYKAAITTVLNPYNITMRFFNYTTYPSVTPGLEQYGCVDWRMQMFQLDPTDAAGQPLRFGNQAAANFNLTAQTTNLGRVTMAGIAQRLGIDTELIQLWGQSIDSERSKLKDEKFFSGENEQVQAEILSRIMLEGQGLLPFTADKQNLLLSTAIQIANQNGLPLLSFNVSSWKAAPAASAGNRKLLQTANDRVLVDVYSLLQPVGNYTPSDFWSTVLTKNSVFLPTTTAKGLAMTGTFQNGTSYYYTRNHTLLGTAADPDDGRATFRPNATTIAGTSSGNVVVAEPATSGGGSGLSGGAIAGIVIGVIAGISIIGLLLLFVWRRHAGEHTAVNAGKGVDDGGPDGKAFLAARKVGDKKRGSPSSVLSLAGSPNTSVGSDSSGAPSSGTRNTDAACVPNYAEVDPEEITICTNADGEPWLLGTGAYGQVYKGVRRGVQQVAIKRLTAVTDPLLLNAIRKEISILQRVSFDRNVVQFYGACLKDPQSAMLIMELCEGGDLRHALSADQGFAWYGAGQHIALDVARGLHFLHSSNVIHRDLKSSNILLTKEGVAKIGDVGLAKTMVSDYFSWETAVGTFAYAAPELLMGDKCSLKVDVYSYGVVLWEICTRGHPVRGQLRDVWVPEDCPAAVEQLIAACINSDVAERPSSEQVVARLVQIIEDAGGNAGSQGDDDRQVGGSA